MSRHEARAVEVAIAKLAARLDADPRLHAERLRAQREFFGAGAEIDGGGPVPTDATGQRFLEWLLLERESEVLGAPPIDVPPYAEEGRDLLDSQMGVFLVLEGDPEASAIEAQDLQDDTVYELSVPPQSLQPGDLLVGRLFDAGSDQWRPSSAAAVFRPGRQLAEAFRRDVERLGLERRLRQVELEHLLLRRADQSPSPTAAPPDQVPLEHLEADFEALLRASGCRHAAADVSAQLAATERPGAVIGPLLEELAFDTDIDLDAARELVLRIWNAHHGEHLRGEVNGAVAAPENRVGESLGERLVRTLDEGLRQQRDVEDLFAQLESMAGIDADEAGDDDADDDADDADEEFVEAEVPADGEPLDGDLDPLVQEYLWETGREREPGAQWLRQWVALQGNAAVPRTDLEQVTTSDLMRLLVHCYLGSAPGQRAAIVQAAFAELQRFYGWAAETQELELPAVLPECRAQFVDQVERFEAAGLALSTAGGGRGRPAILEVEDLAADGFGVRDDEGGNHWLRVPASTAARLREGDLVLGALEPGAGGVALAGIVVVLPGVVRSLME